MTQSIKILSESTGFTPEELGDDREVCILLPSDILEAMIKIARAAWRESRIQVCKSLGLPQSDDTDLDIEFMEWYNKQEIR